MSRCGCGDNCNCVVTAGDCITVTGNGNAGVPYIISAEVDPVATNQLTCGTDGLYVPPPSVDVADTNCVNLSGTGFPGNPITAVLTLDPSTENLLTCGASGLLADLVYTDGATINFSGKGTSGTPLTAEATISPDLGNILVAHANGLYCPSAGAGTVDIYGSLGLSAVYTTPAGVGTVSVASFPWDIVQVDVGTITDVANHRFVVPVGGDGWYHIFAKWRELAPPGDSFEGTGKYYQIRVAINGSGRIVCAKTVDLLVDLVQEYWVEDVVYLNAGDIMTTSWAIYESTGLLAIAGRAMDWVVYGDGTYPCAFEIERIGI